MKKIFGILFFMIVVIGLSAQVSNSNISIADKEKCAEVIYLTDNSEIKITNPVDSDYHVQIYNLTGIEVKHIDNAKSGVLKISTSELKKGIYLVKVYPVPNSTIPAIFKVLVK